MRATALEVREFKPYDLHSTNKWLKKRGEAVVAQMSDVPRIGFFVPGVAAVFLREFEGSIGVYDSLVTNPAVSSKTRAVALNALLEAAMQRSPFKFLMCFTQDAGTISRTLEAGWAKMPNYTFTMWSKN